jgi:cytochrome c oxidase subunit 2
LSALQWVGGVSAALVDTRHEYQRLFSIYVPIAIGVFVLIVLVALFAIARYRRRSPEQAARWHEHNPLEGAYATLLTLTAAFLLYLTFTAEHRVDTVANRQHPSLIVNVTGAKWEWTFTYPRFGITRRSGTVGHQDLIVPAGQAIRFNLTSVDVIHAFWVPHLRFKHDLIPGSTQVSTLVFNRAGVFQGECAEFCGLRHADMLFTVRVVSPSAFQTWAAARGRGATP